MELKVEFEVACAKKPHNHNLCFCLDIDVCAVSCYGKILFNVQPFKLVVVKCRNIDQNCGSSRAAGKYHRSLTWDEKETYNFHQSVCKCYVFKYIY